MADANKFYQGVLEYFDPKADSGIPNFNGSWIGGFGGTNKWLDETPFWPALKVINDNSSATVEAVKVAYVAGQDRTKWLEERLTAINARKAFIQERTNQLLDKLKASGSSAYDGLMKGFTTALSTVPVVGSVISYFAGKDATAKAIDDLKLQRLIQDYTADLGQLGTIGAELLKEYKAAPTTGKQPLTPTGEAPNIRIDYILYAAIVVIFLVFVYLKKRKKRKR